MLGKHGILAALLTVGCLAPALAQDQERDQAILDACLQQADRTWDDVGRLRAGMTSRALFTCALTWCEAGAHLDRIPELLRVAARMQDRDEGSAGFGNFHWYWREGAVQDANAVEFCMQAGTLLSLRHRDVLPPEAPPILDEIFRYAAEGCLRHRVSPSYTNIALMNAGNLMLLGEILGRPEVADEGYRRLEDVLLYTRSAGIHEYCSPTYYGVDLEDLALIVAFCERDEGRAQARALLDLLTRDIAANWFPSAGRLGGARSRDYDYLRGLGYLDSWMYAAGWIDGAASANIYPLIAPWQPSEEMKALSERFPRLVRQSWGTGLFETRTHYLLPNVTLSCSGATYGKMDIPLSVDFAGDREDVRCYLIADGRRDPYGKKRIPTGPHEKALHLTPLLCGAQRTTDALALMVYRPGDHEPTPATLETHVVIPRDVDTLLIGGRAIDLDRPVFAEPIASGEALVIRKGRAAAGFRIAWSRGLDGGDAPVALVSDGNDYGALRLTVAHHGPWGIEAATALPGAAVWARVADGIGDDAALTAWAAQFALARAAVTSTDELLRVSVAGVDGPVAVATAPPFTGCLEAEPEPSGAVLEIDGEDVGARILAALPVVQQFERRRETGRDALTVLAEGVFFEAEDGVVLPQMRVDDDQQASGGKFVWMPGEPGERRSGAGSVTWTLDLPEAGRYYLWARVLAPTPSDDSFFVRAYTDGAEPVSRSDWHMEDCRSWTWEPVKLARSEQQTPLKLPAGEVRLEFSVREDGAKVDRLFLTPFVDQTPE